MDKTPNGRAAALVAADRNYHRTRRSAQVDEGGFIVRDRAVIEADVAWMEAIVEATDDDVEVAYSCEAPSDDAVAWANGKRAAEKIRRWAKIAPDAVASIIADERKKLR